MAPWSPDRHRRRAEECQRQLEEAIASGAAPEILARLEADVRHHRAAANHREASLDRRAAALAELRRIEEAQQQAPAPRFNAAPNSRGVVSPPQAVPSRASRRQRPPQASVESVGQVTRGPNFPDAVSIEEAAAAVRAPIWFDPAIARISTPGLYSVTVLPGMHPLMAAFREITPQCSCRPPLLLNVSPTSDGGCAVGCACGVLARVPPDRCTIRSLAANLGEAHLAMTRSSLRTAGCLCDSTRPVYMPDRSAVGCGNCNITVSAESLYNQGVWSSGASFALQSAAQTILDASGCNCRRPIRAIRLGVSFEQEIIAKCMDCERQVRILPEPAPNGLRDVLFRSGCTCPTGIQGWGHRILTIASLRHIICVNCGTTVLLSPLDPVLGRGLRRAGEPSNQQNQTESITDPAAPDDTSRPPIIHEEAPAPAAAAAASVADAAVRPLIVLSDRPEGAQRVAMLAYSDPIAERMRQACLGRLNACSAAITANQLPPMPGLALIRYRLTCARCRASIMHEGGLPGMGVTTAAALSAQAFAAATGCRCSSHLRLGLGVMAGPADRGPAMTCPQCGRRMPLTLLHELGALESTMPRWLAELLHRALRGGGCACQRPVARMDIPDHLRRRNTRDPGLGPATVMCMTCTTVAPFAAPATFAPTTEDAGPRVAHCMADTRQWFVALPELQDDYSHGIFCIECGQR